MFRSRLLASSNGIYHQRPSHPQQFRRKIALTDLLASPQGLTPMSRRATPSNVASTRRSHNKSDRAAATCSSSFVSSVLSGMESISQSLDQMSLRERSNNKHYSPYRFPPLRPGKPGKVSLPPLSELGLLDYGRQPIVQSIPTFHRSRNSDMGLNIWMERLSLKEDRIHQPYPSFEYHPTGSHYGFEPQFQRDFSVTSPMIYG